MGKFTLEQMTTELLDAGDLIGLHGGYFEDMGGHIISDLDVPSYFDYYMQNLSAEEKSDVLARLSSGAV